MQWRFFALHFYTNLVHIHLYTALTSSTIHVGDRNLFKFAEIGRQDIYMLLPNLFPSSYAAFKSKGNCVSCCFCFASAEKKSIS